MYMHMQSRHTVLLTPPLFFYFNLLSLEAPITVKGATSGERVNLQDKLYSNALWRYIKHFNTYLFLSLVS